MSEPKFDDLLYANGWRDGYWAGKETGQMESSHGGEIAMLRERLRRTETRIDTQKVSK